MERFFLKKSLRNASTARFYSKYILTLLASVLCRSAQADKAPIGSARNTKRQVGEDSALKKLRTEPEQTPAGAFVSQSA